MKAKHLQSVASNLMSLLKSIFIPSILLILCIISIEANACAQWMGCRFKHGIVAAKGIVRTPGGDPIFAEYDTSGDLVSEIGAATGNLKDAEVVSAIAYLGYIDSFNKIEEQHSRYRQILSRDQYIGKSFTRLDGSVFIGSEFHILPSTKSVVVLNEDRILDGSINHILFQAPINLNSLETIGENDRSLLINEDGNVIQKSEHNIGYRMAYATEGVSNDSGGAAVGTAGDDELSSVYQQTYRGRATFQDTKFWNTIAGARIEHGLGRQTSTEFDGTYSLRYKIPACPCFFYSHNGIMTAGINYMGFNPRGASPRTYYKTRPVYDTCTGYSQCFVGASLLGQMVRVNLIAIEATMSMPIYSLNFGIDTAMLSGTGLMMNYPRRGVGMDPELVNVNKSGTTEYAYTAAENRAKVPKALDLNGDTVADNLVCRPDGTIGVYFGDLPQGVVAAAPGTVCEKTGELPELSEEEQENQPDIVRLADYDPDITDQGLLKSISNSDIENTDIFVYRVSKDQLITAREGLSYDEYIPYEFGRVDTTDTAVNFNMMMRGHHFYDTLAKGLDQWQVKTGVNPELHGRNADHLRPGEKVKVIMINRATGYIGTAIGTYDTAQGTNVTTSLNIMIPPVVMRPPNLKITAERKYKVDYGLTKDEEKEYLIGFEGSGLVSDQVIAITTEWYDHDGTPLPPDLPGYTGRLAKVVSEGVLGNSQIANFEIKPGTQLQLVQLPQRPDVAHYYLHVNGEAKENQADFSANGAAGTGLLKHRPDHYVPIQVAVYDDTATRQLVSKLKEQQEAEGEDGEIEYDPVMRWVYRPEMQFSLFDFEADSIERTDREGNTFDITHLTGDSNSSPVVSTSDEMLEILYSITGPTSGAEILEALESFGPGRELILSVGNQELKVEVGGNNKITFVDLDSIAAIDPEDILAIKLYQNGDDANVLWEYAFNGVHISPEVPDSNGVEDEAEEYIYVSADNPTVPLSAIRYSTDHEEQMVARWNTEGAGRLETYYQTFTDENIFYNEINFAPVSDTEGRVTFSLGDHVSSKVKSAKFKVVPGAPDKILITKSGQAAVWEVGKISGELEIFDKNLNKVEDGTPVSIHPRDESVDVAISYDRATQDGKVNFEILGATSPGNHEIVVESGEKEETFNISISDIEISLSSPSVLTTGGMSSITVSASSSISSGAIDIDLYASRGKLASHKVSVPINGSVEVPFYTGPNKGPGRILAIFQDKHSAQNIEVEYPASAGLALGTSVIVGDEVESGSIPVPEHLSEIGEEVKYTTSTQLTVRGEPGQERIVEIGDWHTPNMEPVAAYEMRMLHSGAVLGKYVSENAIPDGVIEDSSSNTPLLSSYRLNNTSSIRIPSKPSIVKANDIGIAINVQPELAATDLLNYVSTGQKISITGAREFKYEIETTNGSFQILSDPIDLGNWYKLAAHYKDNKIILSVDDKEYIADASGELLINGSEDSIVIGNGYEGLVQGLKVYDWTYPKLLSFEDGSFRKEVLIPFSGELNLLVKSLGNVGKYRDQMQANSGIENGSFSSTIVENAYAYEYQPNHYEYQSDATIIRNFIKDAQNCDSACKEHNIYMSAMYKEQYEQNVWADYWRGFLIGSSKECDSMSCIAGDIVGGVTFYGDARDYSVHTYYGYKGNHNYDPVVHLLASIGLAADVMAGASTVAAIVTAPTYVGAVAFGTAATVAQWINVTCATAKAVFKTYVKFKKFMLPMYKILFRAYKYLKAKNIREVAKLLNIVQFGIALYSLPEEIQQFIFDTLHSTILNNPMGPIVGMAVVGTYVSVHFAEELYSSVNNIKQKSFLPIVNMAYASSSLVQRAMQRFAIRLRLAAHRAGLSPDETSRIMNAFYKLKEISPHTASWLARPDIAEIAQKAMICATKVSDNADDVVKLLDPANTQRIFYSFGYTKTEGLQVLADVPWDKMSDSFSFISGARKTYRAIINGQVNTVGHSLMIFQRLSRNADAGYSALERAGEIVGANGKKIFGRNDDMFSGPLDNVAAGLAEETKSWANKYAPKAGEELSEFAQKAINESFTRNFRSGKTIQQLKGWFVRMHVTDLNPDELWIFSKAGEKFQYAGKTGKDAIMKQVEDILSTPKSKQDLGPYLSKGDDVVNFIDDPDLFDRKMGEFIQAIRSRILFQ